MAELLDAQDGASGEVTPNEKLDALAATLAEKRSECIEGRQASGIEQQWKEDEEYYQGVDDANRGTSDDAWSTKPPGQAIARSSKSTKSTVFPNITRPYVDAAAARIADMLLPTDDRSWALQPTPIPDLVEIAEGNIPQDLLKKVESAGGNANDVAGLQQQAQALVEEASKQAEKAQDRITDWHVECQWHAEVRKVIEDASRIGTGILKGPVPVKKRVVALQQASDQQPGMMQSLMGGIKSLFSSGMKAMMSLTIKEEIKPASRRIDPWNFFPDPACGENIHNGSWVWERDYLTRKQLEDLQDPAQGYLVDQIALCLEEGPVKAVAGVKKEPDKRSEQLDDKRFEIWYGHGSLSRDDMEAAGCECDPEAQSISAMVTMVNDHVIKAVQNHLDSGEFPYDVMPWQRKSGLPWGNGVGRQGRTPQNIVKAAVRTMMDNAGLSAGFQMVVGTQIEPSDGLWEIRNRKIWRFSEDADNDDVRKAMTFFEIPSRQKELMEIIQFGLKLMEDATGLPMLLQGQQGKAPDTVGGMTLLNNNASSVLRRLARTFDDCVTEPHIRRYYTWLLQYGNDDEKGDFTIDARGSTALVERDLQNQQIPQLLQASANPLFGIDPKKTMQQYLKSLHFDPKNFEFDDDQWKKLVEGWQKILEQSGEKKDDPRLQVAQIHEQEETKRLGMEQQFEAQQNDAERQNKIAVEMIEAQLDSEELSSVERQVLDKIKAGLAETVMKLNTQRALAATSTAADLKKHATDTAVGVQKHRTDKAADLYKHSTPQAISPPTEPAGRAPTGKSFQA